MKLLYILSKQHILVEPEILGCNKNFGLRFHHGSLIRHDQITHSRNKVVRKMTISCGSTKSALATLIPMLEDVLVYLCMA